MQNTFPGSNNGISRAVLSDRSGFAKKQRPTTAGHISLLSACHEELNFSFSLMLVNLNSHLGLAATAFGQLGLKQAHGCKVCY